MSAADNAFWADPHRAFVDFARRDPAGCDRESFKPLHARNDFTEFTVTPWPVFVSPEQCREARRISLGLTEVLRDLAWSVFDGDPARLAEFHQLAGGPLITQLILDEPNGIDDAIYRGDYILTRDGLKCIEINAGSGVGGWMTTPLGPAYAEVPVVARFLRAHGLSLYWDDTIVAMFRHALDNFRRSPVLGDAAECNTVMLIPLPLEDPRNVKLEQECRRLYAAVLREEGLTGRFDVCHYGDLAFERGCPHLRGRRVHVLFENQVDETGRSSQAFGAFKAGQLELYTGPATKVLSDKRNVALMSQLCAAPCFTDEEQALLRTAIPWTRIVGRESVDYRGERVAPGELLANEREALVLKRAISHSAQDVHFGSATPAARWEELVREALAAPAQWIVQERLESVAYELYSEAYDAVVPHDVVWGFFVFGEAFHGGLVRVAPRAQQLAISGAHGALSALFFELRPDPETGTT